MARRESLEGKVCGKVCVAHLADPGAEVCQCIDGHKFPRSQNDPLILPNYGPELDSKERSRAWAELGAAFDSRVPDNYHYGQKVK